MFQVILVQPEGEENVGAVARAMMNLGFNSLVLVDPKCGHLSKSAMNYSVHAQDVLKNARVVHTLEEALEGSDLKIAVSRRVGQWRKRDFYADSLAEYLKDYPDRAVTLVFGREKNGLTNEEIDLCDAVCSIPTAPDFPSLNLSHAVAIVLYEIHKSRRDTDHASIYPAATREEFDAMMAQIVETLDGLEFFKNVPSDRLENYLRKILVRAKPDSYDVKVIKSVFGRIRAILRRKTGDGKRKN